MNLKQDLRALVEEIKTNSVYRNLRLGGSDDSFMICGENADSSTLSYNIFYDSDKREYTGFGVNQDCETKDLAILRSHIRAWAAGEVNST